MAYYNSKYALWEPVIEPIGKMIITFVALTGAEKFDPFFTSI